MNKYLIDTQSFIWFVEDNEKLPAFIRTLMESDTVRLVLSIASLWEITIKMSLGKLVLSGDIAAVIGKVADNDFEILPIEPRHLISLSMLEFIHRDPFDRIMIAQAINENIPVISSDAVFSQYPMKRIWI
jgi:PIN domain nuclease of toxin-antitoxin system